MKKILSLVLSACMMLSAAALAEGTFTPADSYDVGERVYNAGTVTLEKSEGSAQTVSTDQYVGEAGKDYTDEKVYTYNSLNENDPMPYSTERTLTLREFRGKSWSPVLWTTIAAMEACNRTRRKFGSGIPVGYAFRRIWEGGHCTRSQHYAGVAFDVGQSLSQTQRTAIYNAARSTGAWGYVEPLSQTPTWVHFDRRYGTPACRGTTAGYPTLRRGSRGCYVMILQDALSTHGYQPGSRIDGIFGARTEQALRGYQKRTSLRVDGVCGCNSWKKISTAVLGVGRTKTTID